MKSFRKSSALRIYILFFFLAFILFESVSAQQIKYHHGLEKILNPDGTVKSGVTGSFNVKGYDLEIGKDNKPSFKKSQLNKIASIAEWNSLGTGRKGISNLDGSPGEVYSMAINSDGDIYVGGNIGFVGDMSVNNIAKWDVSENKWKVLPCGSTNGVSGFVETMTIKGSDVYVGGNFLKLADETQVNYIAKFSETTNTWSALTDIDGSFCGVYDDIMPGTELGIYDMGFIGNVLYVGGVFFKLGDGTTAACRAAKWDGTDWYPLTGAGINGVGSSSVSSTNYVDALEVSGDKVYVGGNFSTLSDGTTAAKNIAVWDETNDSWSPLTYNGINGINGYVFDIKISGTTVYAGGQFTTLGNGTTPAGNIAKWVEGSGWSALTSGSSHGVNDAVSSMLVDGTSLYVCGAFTRLDDASGTYNYIAKWDGSAWSTVASSDNSIIGVEGPAIYWLEKSGNDLYIGGKYVHLGNLSTTAYSFAKWNTVSQDWSTYGSGDNGVDNGVRSIVINGNYVYAGGYFSTINGGVIPAKYVARWNYNTEEWSPISSSTTGIDIAPACSVFVMIASGNYLYVAGKFITINGGTTANNIARYNLTDGTWSALSLGGNTGVNGKIAAMVKVGDDIYVGGDFTALSGGTSAKYVAKWNESTGWSAVNGSEANGINNRVLCMANNSNLIYFGGYFSNVVSYNCTTDSWSKLTDPDGLFTPSMIRAIALNGNDVYISCDTYGKNVAKWDGTGWTNLTSDPYCPTAPIYSLCFSGNELYAGGAFTVTSEFPPSILEGFMKWNSTNGWHTLTCAGSASTGMNHIIYTLVPNEAEGKMYVGGYFSLAGGKAAFSIASFTDSDNPLPVELNSFTASILENNVKLNWSTSTEMNNYGFEIEKSLVIGHQSLTKWEKIGFVQGSGNSNSSKEYSFIDAQPIAGIVQYRLKQIDNDGRFKYYSNIAEVNFNITDVNGRNMRVPTEYALEQNYPNPFNPSTRIQYAIPSNVKGEMSNVELTVFDILGNKIATLVNEHKAPGYYEVELNGSSLATGVYIYKLTAGDFTATKKLILMK